MHFPSGEADAWLSHPSFCCRGNSRVSDIHCSSCIAAINIDHQTWLSISFTPDAPALLPSLAVTRIVIELSACLGAV